LSRIWKRAALALGPVGQHKASFLAHVPESARTLALAAA
jgi:hypothetical protein